MNLFDLDDRVTAAAVAAAGTIVGALIQLRAAWRKEVSERARGVPMSRKTKRGPFVAVLLLLVAAGVGGFALSRFLDRPSEREAAALREELRSQLARINDTAVRLEKANAGDAARAVPAVNVAAPETAVVAATLGPCLARHGTAEAACDEAEALHATLCATVSAAATVTATELYARPEGSAQAWSERQLAPGQYAEGARFADKAFERPESERTKQVCAAFADWNGDKALTARLLVRYVNAP